MINPNTNWVAFKTIVRQEIVRFTRIAGQTILPPAIVMSLYFVIFGGLMGNRIGHIENIPYVQYIAPGLIMMSIITNAYANVSFSFFFAKFQGNIEELLVSPTRNSVILLGYVVGGIARGLCVAVVVSLVALFFTHLEVHHILVLIASIVIAASLFSLAGFINAQVAKNFDGISIIPTFVLTPLTYLGGIFYSIDLLSPFWRTLSMFNPILYLVNTFRYGILGVSDVHVGLSLGISFLILIGMYALAWQMLNIGVNLKK